MNIGLQHLLSLSRVFLGVVVLAELRRPEGSYLVLPAVAAACVTDYFDGRVARKRASATRGGKLVDNLCDAVFLALAFFAFAMEGVWSHPLVGSATRYWAGANWLPLIGLGLSFGSYALRWALCAYSDRAMLASPRGHSAGVSNYVLVLLGGVAVIPGFYLTAWLLEPAFVTVTLMNITAAWENLLLLSGHGSA